MIRFVAMIVLVSLACWVAYRLIRSLKKRNIDWTGIAAAVGFVAVAFWLRHVTGIG